MKTRTTLEVDPDLLRKAMDLSGAKTKTEVIDEALKELVRKHHTEVLLSLSGKLESLYDHDELMALRHSKKDYMLEWERYHTEIREEEQRGHRAHEQRLIADRSG